MPWNVEETTEETEYWKQQRELEAQQNNEGIQPELVKITASEAVKSWFNTTFGK